MSSKHRTAPDHELTGWPSGVKYIVGNEGAERFSFYGMKAILYVYLTVLIQATGVVEKAAEAGATSKVHLFIAGVYAFPVLGALIADKLLGKYQTIIWLSLVYCAGHAAMAIFDGNLTGTYVGLALIAVGAGGIKPCVSAHVGDQFGKSNWHLINKVFQAFYFIINFGSFFSTILVPILYAKYGAFVAFSVPGVLMFIATIVFWLGRHDFVHVPPNPGGKLGFLDTVVGFLLFVPLFMLLFAEGSGLISSLPVKLAFSVGGVVGGMMVFSYRQRIQEDDGFLPVLVYCIKAKFQGRSHEIGTGTVQPTSDAPIASHWFFGPAAKKYGAEIAEGPLAVFRIISVFFLVSVFWMLFDQHASTWVEQAKQMDRKLDLGLLGWNPMPSSIPGANPVMMLAVIAGAFYLLREKLNSLSGGAKAAVEVLIAGVSYGLLAVLHWKAGDWIWEPLPSQVSAVNPIMVMILIPIMTFGVFPLVERMGIRATPLRKMSVGMMIAGTAFIAVALVQSKIEGVGEGQVSIGWQLIPYALMTLSEVLVSITGLEFAYTQAPTRMKSIVMSFWLLCVAFGNWFVSLAADLWKDWPLSKSFWAFAGLMFLAGVLFSIRAMFYSYKEYQQE